MDYLCNISSYDLSGDAILLFYLERKANISTHMSLSNIIRQYNSSQLGLDFNDVFANNDKARHREGNRMFNRNARSIASKMIKMTVPMYRDCVQQ